MGIGKPRRLDNGEKEVVDGEEEDEEEDDDDDDDDEPPMEFDGEFCFLLLAILLACLLAFVDLALFCDCKLKNVKTNP